MKKFFASAIVLLLFVTIFQHDAVYAQTPTSTPINSIDCTEERCAECDLCGYCLGKEAPQSWNDCQVCIYPSAVPPATSNLTLKINPETNKPPTAAKGRFYTQIGCIVTDVNDFTKPEGAAVLVDSILNNLIFPTVGGIALLYLIYGAFTLMTSQSNPEKLQQGKTMVMGAIIGLVFTLSAGLIVNIIAGQVLRVPNVNEGTESVSPIPTEVIAPVE